MASSAAPSTPENAPRRIALNRSFTVPPRLSTPTKRANATAEIGAAEGIETLYIHPNANIIKFTTSSRPSSSASASPGRPQSSSGTLSWASPTERTLAAGPMEIYRVPGSVSFLHSGALLHAILPRSQCWCVDGVSKFAFRVLPDTYYRIELPGESEQDRQEVEKLKVTLQKVLFYERTPCPFARTFSVQVPELPEVRKKRRKSSGPAKKWKLDRAYSWKPEGWVPPQRGGEHSRSASTTGSSAGSEEESDSASLREQSGGNKTPIEEGESGASELADQVRELGVVTPSRPRTLPTARTVSAPSQLALQSPLPSRLRSRVDVDGTVEVSDPVEAASEGSEAPRSRTLQAIPTDMPPSPPDSSAGLDYIEPQTQAGDGVPNDRISDSEDSNESQHQFIAGGSAPASDAMRASRLDLSGESKHATVDELVPSQSLDSRSDPFTNDAHSPQAEAATNLDPAIPLQPQTNSSDSSRPTTPTNEDPYAAIQARILARRSIGGTTSFHPTHTSPTRQSTSSTSSTATISSTVSRHQQQAFTTAMVQKAYSVFLGPPAHLVAIMLRIAARFANGAFGVNSVFYVESPADSPRRVPGSYHLEGEDEEEEDWEDDFGVPLRSPVRLAVLRDGVRVRERKEWDD
ncbi:hypothetical protein LTR37_009958 [Vermiconidia calcicola]|uniref:Uncharacterized protein n=1 Tax=Vermiconidia calcicola TaxID=1690605 RepID=A0ACC3N6N9_9PEZI|nr:hypothetical protein LTR37_009958 [Vermiconidia calcicola]